MLPEATRKGIVDSFYSEAELEGCRIGYYGENICASLSEGRTQSANYARIIGIIEENPGGQGITIDTGEAPPPNTQTTVSDIPGYISNRSRVTAELLGAGLSCGFTVLAGVGLAASVAAEVPTGGTSTVLAVVSWVGFASSAAQCINGLARARQLVLAPDSNTLQQWDEDAIYSTGGLIIDAIGVVTAIASVPMAIRNVLAVLERRGGMVTAQRLATMSRAERQKATADALRQATRHPDGRKEVDAALKAAGLTEKQAARALARGAGTGKQAQTAIKAISEVTSTRLNYQIMSALSGGLSPLVSATPGKVTGSASGCVNALIVHVINLATS